MIYCHFLIVGGFEIIGPDASAEVEASLTSVSIKVFGKAQLASASLTAGPVKATVGLAADTGAKISLAGVEAKVFGTGFSFGRKMGLSWLGNGIELNLW